MTSRDFYQYLQSVRQAAHDAQRARDALLAAEHALTRVSSVNADGTHVALGCINRDAMLRRIEAAQQARERYGRLLSESIEVLQSFKEEMSSSPLNDLACSALWLRFVSGLSFESVGDELEVSTATAWRLIRDAEQVLGESLGVSDAPKRQAAPTGG